MKKEISLTEYEQEEFTKEWDKACNVLKESKADLSKIPIAVKKQGK